MTYTVNGASTGITCSSVLTCNGSASFDTSSLGSVIASDVIVDGVSLKTHLRKVEERLLILVPKPELLEKHQMLKEAYEQYKMLEALLSGDDGKL